ncbi:hypothetical protein KCP76_04230 [Salmonella enterica subsp. enterica serovar Weltevreden]|nr:hypothetical protein KCP76_04230 [Salmonella enterica subsp. enterica serovar Weltevreden]
MGITVVPLVGRLMFRIKPCWAYITGLLRNATDDDAQVLGGDAWRWSKLSEPDDVVGNADQRQARSRSAPVESCNHRLIVGRF